MIYFLNSYQLLKSGSKSHIIPNHENVENLIDFWIKQIEYSLKIVIERRSLKISNIKMEEIKKGVKNAFIQYYSNPKY